MGKAAIIVVGAIVIGTAFGVILSNTFLVLPQGGLPALCGFAGLIVSFIVVNGIEMLRKRRAVETAPVGTVAPKPAPGEPIEAQKP